MCHVLVIEDEWLIASYFGDLVIDAGGTSVAFAQSEEEAIAVARERVPNIILSDVNLHEGTGPRAVDAILHEHGQIPVIFVTATPDQCKPCADDAVILRKPVDEQLMIRTFRQFAPLK